MTSDHQKWDGKLALFHPTFKWEWDGIYRPSCIGSAAPGQRKSTTESRAL